MLDRTVILKSLAPRQQQIVQRSKCARQQVCAGKTGVLEQTGLLNLTVDFLHLKLNHSFIMPVIKIVVHSFSPSNCEHPIGHSEYSLVNIWSHCGMASSSHR